MSVYRRGKIWYYHFEIAGNRFRGSTRVSEKAAAERIEAKLRLKAIETGHFPKAKSLTLAEAMLKYYDEHAVHLPSAVAIEGYMATWQSLASKPLDLLTDADIAEHVARRRGERVRGKKDDRPLVSNGTVNHGIKYLRSVCRKAKTWKVAVPEIDWKAHMLPEGAGRTVYLSHDQEAALIDSLRPDFRALVRFCLMTGSRVGAARKLTLNDVDYAAKRITFRKVKGGKSHTVPLTTGLVTLLANERGNHPVYVFTYKAAEDRPTGVKGTRRVKGERYPFSRDGWRRAWYRATELAGIPDFRFHDLRHTAGSRITKAKGIAVAQQLLGHENITTTRRYAHVLMDEVAEAMELVERSTNNHTESRQDKKSLRQRRK